MRCPGTRFQPYGFRRAGPRGTFEKVVTTNFDSLIEKALQEPRMAPEPLGRALDLAREIRNSRLQGMVLNNLGNTHTAMRQWNEELPRRLRRLHRTFHAR